MFLSHGKHGSAGDQFDEPVAFEPRAGAGWVSDAGHGNISSINNGVRDDERVRDHQTIVASERRISRNRFEEIASSNIFLGTFYGEFVTILFIYFLNWFAFILKPEPFSFLHPYLFPT